MSFGEKRNINRFFFLWKYILFFKVVNFQPFEIHKFKFISRAIHEIK